MGLRAAERVEGAGLAVAFPDITSDLKAAMPDLRGRLLALPPHTEVWPGHLGGSLCGSSGIDLKTSSTIGFLGLR